MERREYYKIVYIRIGDITNWIVWYLNFISSKIYYAFSVFFYYFIIVLIESYKKIEQEVSNAVELSFGPAVHSI